MKIFTAEQIREGDAYTIAHEPVSSLDLMERAARQCEQWISAHFDPSRPVYVFCGTGNNGGDGLVITRLLHEAGYQAQAYIIFYSEKFSTDCEANKSRLEHAFGSRLQAVYAAEELPELPENAIIVDALFGTGLNRSIKGLAAEAVSFINTYSTSLPIIAVDMPSGLRADESSVGDPVIEATHTLSFEFYKLAFLMPENAGFTGQVHLLPIDIHPEYIKNTPADYLLTGLSDIRKLYRHRSNFSHKGTYGHALMIAGSYGKMGAATLSTKACIRSGVGLLTCFIPACGYDILQTSVPEAMCLCDKVDDHWSEMPADIEKYEVIGVGPGLGQHPDTLTVLEKLLVVAQNPMVLDADALNLIGKDKQLLKKIPANSILTPHSKEFERLFGSVKNNFERLAIQLRKSRELNLVILLKGHFTCITTPDGRCFFNSTGNAGMATGGSGDVLTGILTGLLAQGYDPPQAAVFGAYLHGLAGDTAADHLSPESLIASDIISCLGNAFKKINNR